MTSYDRNLILQNVQKRYIRLRVLSKEWLPLGDITGRCVSGSISIDSSSNARRSASLTLVYDTASRDVVNSLAINNYVQVYCGIEDNDTAEVMWYSQGVFVISDGGIKVSQTDRSISLNLSDMMIDLTGDRAGTLHAYTSKVARSQRIDDVMLEVLGLGNVPYYNICSIHPNISVEKFLSIYSYDPGGITKTEIEDESEARKKLDEEYYGISYDMKFEVGVSCYDILSKLVGMYPYYEMYFAANGTFVCKQSMSEEYNDLVLVDDEFMKEVTISDDIDINWSEVKNHIEVWGKEGKYFGEASDTKGDSPFREDAVGTRRLVVSSNEYGVDTENICDKYGDEELANKLIQEQAKLEQIVEDTYKDYYSEETSALDVNDPVRKEKYQKYSKAEADLASNKSKLADIVTMSGDNLAAEWAEYLLWKKCRLQDKIVITTILMPSLNEVNFKLGYRSKTDSKYRTWYVTGVQHDLASNTTTITASLFDNSVTARYLSRLGTPVIANVVSDNVSVTVTTDDVRYAEIYELYIDDILVATSTYNTVSYAFDNNISEGSHTVKVTVSADGFLRSQYSEECSFTRTRKFRILDENGNYITAEDGSRLIYLD